jgi:hypothetical protein
MCQHPMIWREPQAVEVDRLSLAFFNQSRVLDKL